MSSSPQPPNPFDRDASDSQARRFFDDLWAPGDPWALEHSALDQDRYRRQLELLANRRYGRALEVGCAAGSFTRRLALLCDELVALDVAASAIDRAREGEVPSGVEFRVANVMEVDWASERDWDLVVMAETAYYLGWLYPLFDVAWLFHELHEATRPDGRLLLANTISTDKGVMSSWLIRSYRDLVRNAGFAIDHEEMFRGTKNEVEFEILLTLYRKPS